MKGIQIHIILIALLLQGVFGNLPGQPPSDSVMLHSPVFRENLYLVTDRALYASGDPVRFRIFYLTHQLLKENNWSKVVYLELINGNQTPVSQGKFFLGPDGACGALEIPDTVSTGSFYLRAYTKWMRNFLASDYVHTPLTVVNPQQFILPEPAAVPSGPQMERMAVINTDGISCLPDRTSYGKREKVTVQLITDPRWESPDGYAVSVVKMGHQVMEPVCYSGTVSGDQVVEGLVRYPPETRGISVTGKIVNGSDHQPVAFANMHMTLLGAEPDYFGFVSDDRGDIQISIPSHTGAENALISFDNKGDQSYELVMDKAFSQRYTDAPPGMAGLFDHPDVIEEALLLAQIRESFNSIEMEEGASPDTISSKEFYGTPEYRYRTASYISLPNMEEFFFELIPQVMVQKYRGETSLVMMDEGGFPLEYTPLILLDHVAMNDLGTLLSIDPQQIEYIDIVNQMYTRGGNYYGGIISIISKEGNLAGAGLPEGSVIIDLQTYRGIGVGIFPERAEPARGERIPDLRTTLYWEADRKVRPGTETRLEFFTSDIEGTYIVMVHGLTKEGLAFNGKCEFTVE
jgi:hypothetical protein